MLLRREEPTGRLVVVRQARASNVVLGRSKQRRPNTLACLLDENWAFSGAR